MDRCTLSMLAGPRDAPWVERLFRHAIRMCAFDFQEKLLVIDDLPGGADMDALEAAALRLAGDGARIVRLSGVDSAALARKHFGSVVPCARDHRGVPLFGWIAGIEAAPSDYVVHFDSDILLHQPAGCNWIAEGMELIASDPAVMCVAPHPGPPAADGTLIGHSQTPTRDSAGNLRFRRFSSRRFLLSRRRLEKILPVQVAYISRKRRAAMGLGIGNAVQPWEVSVSRTLEASDFEYAHLAAPRAWSLHCPDHGEAWATALPMLIERVEEGWYPSAQAGKYDLEIEHWLG